MWHSFQSMFTVRLVSSTLSFPRPFRQKSIATTLVLFASRHERLSLSDERCFKRKWPSNVVQIGHQRTNRLGSVNRRKQDRRQRFQSLWFKHVAWHTRRMATKAATVLLLPLTRNDLLTEGRSHAPGRPAKKWVFSALFRYLCFYIVVSMSMIWYLSFDIYVSISMFSISMFRHLCFDIYDPMREILKTEMSHRRFLFSFLWISSFFKKFWHRVILSNVVFTEFRFSYGNCFEKLEIFNEFHLTCLRWNNWKRNIWYYYQWRI